MVQVDGEQPDRSTCSDSISGGVHAGLVAECIFELYAYIIMSMTTFSSGDYYFSGSH